MNALFQALLALKIRIFILFIYIYRCSRKSWIDIGAMFNYAQVFNMLSKPTE